MVLSCLINIKPFVFLQGPLRDRPVHLLILPPLFRCIDLLCLLLKLLCALECCVSSDIFLLLIYEEHKASADVLERGPAIRKHLTHHVKKLGTLSTHFSVLIFFFILFLGVIILNVGLSDAGYVP